MCRQFNPGPDHSLKPFAGTTCGRLSSFLAIGQAAEFCRIVSRNAGILTRFCPGSLMKAQQADIMERTLSDNLTAAQLEKLVNFRQTGDGTRHKNDASANLVRFRTSGATVTVTFRRTITATTRTGRSGSTTAPKPKPSAAWPTTPSPPRSARASGAASAPRWTLPASWRSNG